MLTKNASLNNKVKMERLALIKERYHRLVLKNRQDLERDLDDGYDDDEEYSEDVNAEPIAEYDVDDE